VLRNNPKASTSISLPERLLVNNGVITMAAMVESAVILTDNAKLDRDKNTITLEAVPPGQLETKINPTAKKGGNSNAFPKNHPKNGMTENCNSKPMITHLGVWVTLWKSSNRNVKPIPNIMPPNPRVIPFPENQVKRGGWNRAKQEADKTIQGKAAGIWLNVRKGYGVL
jgi:hypothetical protein